MEVDAASWHQQILHSRKRDWSATDSGVSMSEGRPAALAIVRDQLRFRVDESGEDLADFAENGELRPSRDNQGSTGSHSVWVGSL